VATYLCDTSSDVEAVADTAGGLFLSGMFVGHMDVDPTGGVKQIAATFERMPFATALTRDGTMMWGDPLATTPTNAADANPMAVRAARPDGSNVVLGLGDITYLRNAWRIDPATGQLQTPDLHLGLASDLDVRPDTGDIVAVDGSHAWAIDPAGQQISAASDAKGDNIRVDPTGGTVVAGNTRGVIYIGPRSGTTIYTPMEQDIQVTKVNADGMDWSWRTVIGGQARHTLGDVAVGGDGTIYVVGYFGGTIATAGGNITAADSSEAFAAALNPDGTIRWLTVLGAEIADSIAPLPDGNVLVGGYGALTVAGSRPPANADTEVFMVELDATGNHVWSANSDLPARLHLGTDGALYVYGSIDSTEVDATAYRGGTLKSYGDPPLHYQSGIVVKMVIR